MRHKERGSALFIAMLIVMVVAALAVVVVSDSVAKAKDADLENENVRALFVAESAIDLAMNAVQTGANGKLGTSNWTTASDTVRVDGLPTLGEPHVILQNMPNDGGEYYTWAMFWGNNGRDDDGDGLMDAADKDEKYIWTIWAWGRYGNTIRRIKVIAEYHLVQIWDNAIVAGSGASGMAINGNATVHGGMLIFAEDAAGNPTTPPTATNFLFSGAGGVQDNYVGLDPANIARMRPIGVGPNGLKTYVRLKHGKAGLSGTGTLGDPAIGLPDDPATIANDQMTVDGVFITDGYGGNQGASNVFSDNGPYNPWDLPPSVRFPRLTDPYFDPVTGIEFPSYDAYVASEGLTVTAATLATYNTAQTNPNNRFRIDADTASFTIGPDAKGNRIQWNTSTNTLTINGVINFQQTSGSGDFHLGGKKTGTVPNVNYTGRGTMYIGGTGGDAHIHTNVVPVGQYLTNDTLGFIAKNNLGLADGSGDAQLSIFGIFRAGNTISSQKQNQIMGCSISEYFNMGTNVPKIAHHPDVAANMPPGFNSEPIPTTLYLDAWGEW